MRAMILAAGYGSRLGELTRVRPKPMLPVCGAPLVRWTVLWLRHHGVREIVINLHHLGEQIEAELGDGRALGVAIQYSREHGQILGTGGGLRKARPLLDAGDGTPFVVVNGKILIDLDLGEVVRTHVERGAEATMVLREDPEAARWGSLRLDATGRVVRLLGGTPDAATPDRDEPTTPPLMFTGVHVITPRVLDRVPPEGEQCILRTAYRSLFHTGQGLHGFVTSRYWWEHSTPERYLEGVWNVLRGSVPLPYAEHPLQGVLQGARVEPGAVLREPVWIGPGAIVESGARVGPCVQIGSGARVRSGVELERCIVWDDADVRDSAHDRVIA